MFHERRFRWLLRLLPASFREEHERELLRVWRDEASDAARAGRRGVWADALKDTLRVAPREFADTWWRNVRFAARSLRRSPGFTITAVLTLAIGTGATAAVFTLVNGVLLRPLPWMEPDRVGIIWPIQPSGARTWLSLPELEELQRELSSVTHVSGVTDLRPNLLIDGIGREVQALAVSHQFFAMLGIVPTLGRDFSSADDREGAVPAVILSHAFWRTQFGGSPRIVGSLIRLNEREYSVIGVLPATFAILPASSVMPERVDVWLPLELHLPSRDRSVRFLHVLARLRPGVSFAHAGQDLQAYGMRVAGQFASVYRGGVWRFTIASFKDDVLKNTRMALYLVFGLVLLVLLMACSNVANLLLARGEARRAELAVRTALGAGPARLAGELMAEALVLATAGSVLGLCLAVVLPHTLRALEPDALPRLDETGIDPRVALFVGGLIFLTAAIFVFAPLMDRLRLQGVSAAMPNRSGGRTRRSARLGSALVVVQTALATTVLITTCFLTVTFVRLHSADLGFATDGLLTARMTLSPRYAEGADVARFFESATTAVEQVGGVIEAAAITQLPLSGAMLGSTFLSGPGPAARRIDADLRGVTPDYFEVARTPILRGRTFTDRDAPNRLPVAIVDELFARRLSPDGEVVGHRIHWFRQPEVQIEIVGVVRSVRHRGPADPPRETVYRPHRQYPRNSMFLVVRTSIDAATAASSMRSAVSSVDPSQPIADVATMSQRLDRSVTQARTSLMLAAVLAGLALGLGLIGLYGVLSFGVAQRLREFGVRMALGASPAAVRKLVLKEGLTLTLTGVAIGVITAAAVAMLIRSGLYGTGFTDVRQYLLGAALVLLSSIAAFWLPARRASAADPLVSLRAE